MTKHHHIRTDRDKKETKSNDADDISGDIDGDKLLTNYESIQLFRQSKHELTDFDIQYLLYLSKTPALHQRKDSFEAAVTELRKLPLTKQEMLQLLNNVPSELKELKAYLPNWQDRFDEEQLDNIIQLLWVGMDEEEPEKIQENDPISSE